MHVHVPIFRFKTSILKTLLRRNKVDLVIIQIKSLNPYEIILSNLLTLVKFV